MSGPEFAPPKYAQIVQALRRRIADGTYQPGSLLPSEAQLVREFGVSRPTVVRALQHLRLLGVIDREHGKGSFVKASPALAAAERPRTGRAILDRAESAEPGELITAGPKPPPRRVALVFSEEAVPPLVLRQLIFRHEGTPAELVSMWLPAVLAAGTDLERPEPLGVGVRQLLQSARGVRFDHVVERLSARRPVEDEASLLHIAKTAPVLVVLATAFDATGSPLLAAEVVFPGELHELEDVYPV